MFLDLLSIIAGVAGCLGSVLAAKGTGFLNLLTGWLVGLLVGFACFWVLRVGIRRVLQRQKLYEAKLPPAQLLLTWLLCLGAIVWIILAGFLGSWITTLVIHLRQQV
jgi:fatty acid desaturase